MYPRVRQAGFTLIELLVVIVIIATLAGMATLSLGGSSSRAWAGESQRLANLLQLVADRALIDRAHYGVAMEEDGYRVLRFDASQLGWSEVDFTGAPTTQSRRFAAHQLPGDMRLEVLSEAQLPGSTEAEFAAERSKQKSENKPLPQFVALSSGEVLPAELALHLLRNGRVSRSAIISYSGLDGLTLEWLSDD